MLDQLEYDHSDAQSIIAYAKKLMGQTLLEACGSQVFKNTKLTNKGGFGTLLEEYYFKYKPNSKNEPDFMEAGLELKASPLRIRVAKNDVKAKFYAAKERISLNIIDYVALDKEDFFQSTFWKKNAYLLLVFYIHNAGVKVYEQHIEIVGDWSFPEDDRLIIEQDWYKIQSKVKQGLAHEISEGDTFYLGACTKGANSKSVRKQPHSPLQAKQRAFSLKQGYVNHIVAKLAAKESKSSHEYGKIIQTPQLLKTQTLESYVVSKFEPYYGQTISEIIAAKQIQLNPSAKHRFAMLTNAILGVELDKKIEEFEKANIIVKTVRLNKQNLPKEDISFQAFKYTDIASEDWDESSFKGVLEQKFLFVFFQESGQELSQDLRLKKVCFWNMPASDIESAKLVWVRVKELLRQGMVVESVNGLRRKTFFPNKLFNPIAHIRPHARNAQDTYPLPVKDLLTGLEAYTKYSFWLNNTYVRDSIYLGLSK